MHILLVAAVAAGMVALPAAARAHVDQPTAVVRPSPQPPAGSPPAMPARDRSGRPPANVVGTAVISGRVVDAETGLPLRRVSVQAFPTTGSPGAGARTYVARTDDTGAYTIGELPAGVYTVMARRGGYVMQTLGQSGPSSLPRRLTVEDRAKIPNVDFRLQPGGVIAGRVIDDAGEPAEGVMLQVLQAQRVRGQVRYRPAGGRGGMSDDLGNFRLYGLAPGEYIVSAEPSNGRMMGPAAPTRDAQATDTVRTYAPGTPAPADAERVRVVAGQVTSIDIQLVASRVVTVSGRVVDSTGRALGAGMVMLRPDGAEVMAGGFGGRGMLADGTFTINSVVPGAYMLQVMAAPQRPMGGPDDFAQVESATMPLVVGSEDLTNLTVTTSPPSSVVGRLVVEGNARAIQPSALRVFARPIDPEPMMFGPPGTGGVKDDLSISISGLRGPQLLHVNGLPRGWWVKAIRVNGQDALDGFDFGSGRAWPGLEIVVNDRPSSIGGEVMGADGRPATEYVVLAFPQDYERRATLRTPGVSGLGTPDQNGGFVVESLRPGEYFVIATPSDAVDPAVLDDPDRLRELSQRASQVTLREGDLQFLRLALEH